MEGGISVFGVFDGHGGKLNFKILARLNISFEIVSQPRTPYKKC